MATYWKGIARTFCIRKVSYKVILLLICAAFIGIIVTIPSYEPHYVIEFTNSHFIRTFPNKHFQEKPVKRILIWQPHISEELGELENNCLKKCPVKCITTQDKSEIADVDAIDFHLSNLWTKFWTIDTKATIKFPTYRRPDQVWYVSNMEPPQHLWGDLKVFNGIFNWTRWYRMDATVTWRYGFPYRLNKTEKQNATLQMKDRNIFREKTKGIMGRISNCHAQNRRYKTIYEMQRHLDMDMFGLCYNNPCGNPSDQWDKSCDILMKEYKFYLAFENNDCRDYVTEKYWFALNRDQIPIVNWRSVDPRSVIPKSFINIYDFKDLESLAKYVKQVSNNETLYNSYMEWRKEYANFMPCPSCDVCQALHDKDRPAQVVEDFDGWVRNDICRKVEVRNILHLSRRTRKPTICMCKNKDAASLFSLHR